VITAVILPPASGQCRIDMIGFIAGKFLAADFITVAPIPLIF